MSPRTPALTLLLGTLLLPPAASGHTILLEPNGGEIFVTGEVVTIRWAIGIAHNLQNWDLWYNVSDGTVNASCTNLAGSWTVIELDVPPTCAQGGGGFCSPGPCVMEYLWTIPDGLDSDTVKIRVRMDNAATDYYDVSNAPFSIVQTSAVRSQAPERVFFLGQNEPNPFNPSTAISFVLEEDQRFVRLAIYDSRGALVRTLVSGTRSAGRNTVAWDGVDESGARVASGVYFYQLEAGDRRATRKLVLVE